MKNIVILGSTGSIGKNALEVISELKNSFKVIGMSAGVNAELLSLQIRRFRPSIVALKDAGRINIIKKAAAKSNTRIFSGTGSLCRLASAKDADTVLVAITGSRAIMPILSAIRSRKTVALANKEAMVSAGSIITAYAKKYKTPIIPVDSEHSAIFQCISAGSKSEIRKIYLTGTGGPLRLVPKRLFSALTKEQVTAHPKWSMGKKISVDSATLMNKGLEVIEARWIFDIDPDKIEVLIHPEAIIHSMVEFIDGSVIAQMAAPDMKLPIQYALAYPARMPSRVEKLDFFKHSKLTFFKPDLKKFPCLEMAIKAARTGGDAPAALNAANEIAVEAFLKGEIKFSDIPDIVKKIMKNHKTKHDPSLADILHCDRIARERTKRLCYPRYLS